MIGILVAALFPSFTLAPPLAAATVDDSSFMLIGLFVTIGLALLVGVLAHFGYRKLRRHRHHSHSALFNGLCDAHQLDANSRKLLAQLVRFHRLVQPARLFMEPQWFDPAKLNGPLLARAEELLALRNRLFSVLAPAAR